MTSKTIFLTDWVSSLLIQDFFGAFILEMDTFVNYDTPSENVEYGGRLLLTFYEPLILLRNFPEHLNVTTLLGLSIIESPVAGFLPRLSFLSFTQNFPNLIPFPASCLGKILYETRIFPNCHFPLLLYSIIIP